MIKNTVKFLSYEEIDLRRRQAKVNFLEYNALNSAILVIYKPQLKNNEWSYKVLSKIERIAQIKIKPSRILYWHCTEKNIY